MNDKVSNTMSGKILQLPVKDNSRSETAVNRVRRSLAASPGLTAELHKAREESGEFALLILRLSEFREFAESFGEASSRRLGREVLLRLEDSLPDGGPVFALHGGEFATVLSGQDDLEELDDICARLVQACSGRYRVNDVAPVFKAVVGVARYPLLTGGVDDLVRFARIALRRAEAAGENFDYFSRDLLRRQRRKLLMEGDLEQAMAEQRFLLHFQPQYAMDTDEIVGMEALLRLVAEDGELVPPGDFIAIAEENGFIVPLGHWVIGEACRQLSEWRRFGCGLRRIAVNLSLQQLLDEQLSTVIDRAVADNGLKYGDLELEVTESRMLEHLPAVSEVLHDLRARGVRIAIDDFGAGYSCFAALVQLPLDIFKLDKSLLANAGEISQASLALTSMVGMARELGHEVVATGVETTHQYEFLREIGCTLGQGFALAHPQDAFAIDNLLNGADEIPKAG